METLEIPEEIRIYLETLNTNFAKNKIKKRDGKLQKFDIYKVYNAVKKSFEGEECDYAYANITFKLCHDLLHLPKYKPSSIFEIEELQDAIRNILMREYPCVAEKFIVYREQRRKARDDKKLFDVESIIDGYLSQGDWRVKENSNSGYSIGGLIHHNASTMISYFWLNRIYSEQIKLAHTSGDLHIHDLGFLGAYCLGHSFGQLIEEGLHGVNGNLSSFPAKHMHTLINQSINFLGIMQNESAGAQAFSSFDTYIAPFIAYDKLNYDQVKQNVQSFIFGCNIPSRWSSQSPFINITLDLKVNPILSQKPVIIGGKWWKKTGELIDKDSIDFDNEEIYHYSDFQKEMDMFNQAFIELMYDGDRDGRIFSYPIPTVNITKDFDWDSPVSMALWKLTGKYGTPYFSNFVNSDMKPEDSFSMCCRLRLDLAELKRRGGGLFGASERTGSIGVVTINLPRIAYKLKQSGLSLGKNDLETLISEYKSSLRKVMDIARDSLELKRKTINKLTEQGLFPYIARYLKTWNNHFSTIGILGMNEACLNLLGKDISDPIAKDFALQIGGYIRDTIMKYQEETGNLYNYESTPGEGTSYRFAKIDKKEFSEIITSGVGDNCYYTNSTALSVGHTNDLFDAADHQDPFMVQYTGGCVFHAMLGESIDDPDVVKKLVQKISSNYRMPYFSLTPTFSVCEEHGYLKGLQEVCPQCGKVCDCYSRVVGYYRPVKNWNKGKAQEFKERVTFIAPKEITSE